jgi:hypothetical protein
MTVSIRHQSAINRAEKIVSFLSSLRRKEDGLSGEFSDGTQVRLHTDGQGALMRIRCSGNASIVPNTTVPLSQTEAGVWHKHPDFRFTSAIGSLPTIHDEDVRVLAEMIFQGFVDTITLDFEDVDNQYDLGRCTDQKFGWSFFSANRLMSVFGVGRHAMPTVQIDDNKRLLQIAIVIVPLV